MTTWLKFDDYATPATAGQVDAMKAAGVRVVGRYAGLGSTWKHLTPAERDMLFGAGIGIFALAESTIDRALAGYHAGAADAQTARAAWRALGLPDSHPICFAVDFNATADQLTGSVTAYFQGIASVEHADWDYGGFATVDWLSRHALAGGGFQTYAWSAGKWSSFAAIKQERNDVPIDGLAVDLGEIDATVPVWYVQPAAAAAASNPTTGPLADVLRDGGTAAENIVLTEVRAGYLANTWAPAMTAAVGNLQVTLNGLIGELRSRGVLGAEPPADSPGAPAAGPGPSTSAVAAPSAGPA